jgi:hypothetical protein
MSRLADIAVAVQEWAVAALTASAELAAAFGVEPDQVAARIWDSTPPPEAELPYIDLRVTVSTDVNTIPLVEVMARAELTAKVVGMAESYEDIRPHAVVLHQALQGKTSIPLNGGGTMLSSRRLRSIAYPEQTEGIEYRHLGGTYEVFAQ